MTETASPRRFATLRRVLAPERLHPRQIGPGLLRAWRWLRASVLWKHWLLIFVVVGLSVFSGYATAILEQNALYIAVGLLLSAFILIDFRVGAMALIIMMPISGSNIFPHELLGIKGLNPINFVLLSTLFSYGARRMFVGSNYKFFPRELVWFYVLPLAVAAAIGAQHFDDIPGFMLADAEFSDAQGFIRDLFIKPMFLVLFALIVGAAVAETRRAETFLIVGFVSVWIMVITAVGFFLVSGVSIGDISGSESRGFFSPIGFHANGLGRLMAVAFALALFSAMAYRGDFSRAMVWLTAGMAALATMLTFSRGSFLVLVTIGALYVLALKRDRMFLVLAVVLPVLLLAMPSAVYDRISFGLGGESIDLNTVSSDRTSQIWEPLIPEIFDSPIIGHGLSSILWSDALKSGAISPVTHPHNAFLKALLDTGLVGTVLTLIFFWHLWKRMRDLSRDQLLDPVMRGFFAGAAAAMVGFGVGGIAGSAFDPVVEQVFLWFAIGILYGVSSLRHESQETRYG